MEDDIKSEDWINARVIDRPTLKPQEEPKIDPEVSKIVGKPVRVNDPRLMKVIVELKRLDRRGEDSLESYDFLKDGSAIEKIREAFK